MFRSIVYAFVLTLFLVVAAPAPGQAVQGKISSGQLVAAIEYETGAIRNLKDNALGLNWWSEDAEIYRLEKEGQALEARVTLEAGEPGQVVLGLTIHNPTDRPITTDVTFPWLEGLTGGDAATLSYCYPRQDIVLGSTLVQLDQPYSSRFPLQFVTAYQPGKGGIYLMTCDTQMHRKRFYLQKNGSLAMGAVYPGVTIEPGQTTVLPEARLGVYAGDWHQALHAYRQWVETWYQPTAPRKQWFREVFHFRQVFLYPNLDTPGLFDTQAKTLSIAESIEQDREQFGAVDYVHLFDWSQTPDQGRVGVYSPWHHLPRPAFNEEIDAIQRLGLQVGLYFEGYLVSPSAEIPGRPGRSWQLLTKEKGRYDPFGSGDDYLCPAVGAWQDHLTDAVVRAAKQTKAKGYYIDQFGFGYQYPCYDETHGHAIPSNQPRREADVLRKIRSALDPGHVLYTEQAPVDVATQYQDASFSYSLMHARNPQCPSRTNLLRFAFPDFKTIQILKGDGPIGDDVEGVNLAFYNGEGIWLVGPSDNNKWYSPKVLTSLRKTHALRMQWLDAFTSDDVTPLVPTLEEGIYANRFASGEHTVWTLYNGTDQPREGDVLRVKHVDGARYYDAWNQVELNPTIRDGLATLSVQLTANGVGCVVRTK